MSSKTISKPTDRPSILGRISDILCVGAILFALQAAGAKAANVEALSRMLAAAFIADQTVVLCTVDNPLFARQTAGPLGTSRDYLEHVRAEILSSIPPREARRIVVAAADITRRVGLSQVRAFSPNYPDIPALTLRRWCDTDGTGLVREFIAKHDSDHDQFLKEIADAKRPTM
jgi:hypothetical protein